MQLRNRVIFRGFDNKGRKKERRGEDDEKEERFVRKRKRV